MQPNSLTAAMRRNRHSLTLLFLSFIFSMTASIQAANPNSEYSVGVAAVDITPSYPVRLNGFGFRRDESEGVYQRVWAKALAICDDSKKPVILMTLDNLGIPLSMTNEVAERLGSEAAISRDRLVITFTHTHTAPKVSGASDTIFSTDIPPDHQRRIDQYTDDLTNALVKVSLEALANCKPSRLERATGTVKFAVNRRTPSGPVDHTLPLLVVRCTADNSIQAIYTTYACHCVTLSHNQIGGDWAGYAQEAIQRNYPGVVAMVSIGCGSDANPNTGVTGENVAAAAEQGAEIAAEVDRLIAGELTPVVGPIAAKFSTIELPLNKASSREELEAAVNDSAAGYNATVQLGKLNRGEPLQSKITYPIQSIAFGDSLAMVFLGGEVCVDYKLRAAREFDSTKLWMHGYSNDFCAYIPSERLLKEGGYGGGSEIHYFALPSTLKAGLEGLILSGIHRQLPAHFETASADEAKDAAAEIKQLLNGLAVNTPAEYERIPAIWRVAIEAGKRNSTDELRRLLDLTVPKLDEPAQHWQVVVCGGGIINGLTQAGVWPRRRITALLESNSDLSQRYERFVRLASDMAEDESVRAGTRYDALRILGTDKFHQYEKQLKKYLSSDDAELQMGAVSALGDMESTQAAELLLASMAQYNETNRNLAVQALLRDDSRRLMLKQAIDRGEISPKMLSQEVLDRLSQ